MRSDSSTRAVSRITGIVERALIQRQSSRPSVPGNITSSTTRPGSRDSISPRAVSPSSASSVTKPSRRRYFTTTLRTTGSSSTTRTVVILLLWLPLRVVAARPVLPDGSGHHAPERVPRRRVEQGQVEVPDEQHRRREEEPVVEHDRAGEAKACVALPQPEQEA